MPPKPPTKIIKRYQNRKLYDTSDSCYVTLDEISDMIKQGEEIEIIDNTTKEDITAVTLAQIIFEEQKQKKNVLPLGTFRTMIQGSSEALRDLVQLGAREIDHVKDFVDDKVRPAVNRFQEITSLRGEMKTVIKRLEAIEQRMTAVERHHP
jgi:polyhydroxyalkanoate synthesis repressor PhaR